MPLGVSANTTLVPQIYVHSLTEDEARSRIEADGYAGITDLQRDVHGNWHGMATRNGKAVQVTLDFKGYVTHKAIE